MDADTAREQGNMLAAVGASSPVQQVAVFCRALGREWVEAAEAIEATDEEARIEFAGALVVGMDVFDPERSQGGWLRVVTTGRRTYLQDAGSPYAPEVPLHAIWHASPIVVLGES
jgi:hypothetical protein